METKYDPGQVIYVIDEIEGFRIRETKVLNIDIDGGSVFYFLERYCDFDLTEDKIDGENSMCFTKRELAVERLRRIVESANWDKLQKKKEKYLACKSFVAKFENVFGVVDG